MSNDATTASPPPDPQALISRLVERDPWESSWEGLDDACHFCRSDHRTPGDVLPKYHHLAGCAWIDAMALLGRPHPEHAVGS
jgi:hypothetical protein